MVEEDRQRERGEAPTLLKYVNNNWAKENRKGPLGVNLTKM